MGTTCPVGTPPRRLFRLMLTRRFGYLYPRRREASEDRRQPQPAGRYRTDPAPAQNFVPSLPAAAACCARGGAKRLSGYAHRICGRYVPPANRGKIKSRAERTRTADLKPLYEFAAGRSSPSWCLRKLRLFRQFWVVRRCRFVQCVYQRVLAQLQYGCSKFGGRASVARSLLQLDCRP